MKRKDFLKTLLAIPVAGAVVSKIAGEEYKKQEVLKNLQSKSVSPPSYLGVEGQLVIADHNGNIVEDIKRLEYIENAIAMVFRKGEWQPYLGICK